MSALTAAQLAALVVKAKLYMRIGDDDAAFQSDGIAVFCSASDATAATVQVTDTTVVLVITGGANAGTTTLTLADAANDTLTELASVIDGTSGWTANLVGQSDINSGLLVRRIATNALAQGNEVTLVYENEELLELLITNSWKRLETAMGGWDILSTASSKLLYHEGGVIDLESFQVSQVTMVGDQLEDGLTVTYTGSDPRARVEVTSTAVVTTSITDAGTTTTTTSTFASNVTTTAMATTINALSGWTATVVNAAPSDQLARRGAQDAKDRIVTLEAWTDYCDEYTTDYNEGLIRGVWPTRNPVRVDFTAGYSTMPADVEQVLLEMVKQGYESSSKDSSATEEKIGDYAYKMASQGADSVQGMGLLDSLRRKYERVTP